MCVFICDGVLKEEETEPQAKVSKGMSDRYDARFCTSLPLASHRADLSLTIRLQGAALGRDHFGKRPLSLSNIPLTSWNLSSLQHVVSDGIT